MVAAVAALLSLGVSGSGGAGAQDSGSSYATFTSGATAQRGLFTIWHKDGKVYLELAPSQLDHDFIQTIVPASGLGGAFLVYGNSDHLPSELLRFERAGNAVAMLWPNPGFIAPHSQESQRAIDANFPRSIVGLAPIVAVDDKTGDVVIDAAPFLEDQLNLKAVIGQSTRSLDPSGKAAPYVLDSSRTYFGQTKSFPKNVLIEALQAWTSTDQHLRDVPADPRYVQMRVAYNIADVAPSPDYMPRLADDRMGIYDDVYLSFDNDQVLSRKLRYVVRWNLQPSDPSKPISPATHPMIFYMSNTVPVQYRAAIRAAVLKWNDAFLKIGISDALQVRDQPNDPSWDPDDIRYNVLRWVPEARASFGADSQTLYDPRTGEEFRTGILISADVPSGALRTWTYFVDPVRYGRSTDPMPQKFLDDQWLGVIMHETGHNLGMQHNFIGSMAYTAKQLQDPAFTARYGIASTVMEYAPVNLWPKSYGQGTYQQTVLGPYDYHLMQWTYERIPGATTPQAEVPALEKLAAQWSDPKYRYDSDEDVAWASGHAADPRSEQGDLTDDPLAWCAVQIGMDRDLVATLNARFPAQGQAYEAETDAFAALFGAYSRCATLPAHFIGGQYISRAHRGDPGAQPPIVPVPRAQQYRAFQQLDRDLFAANPLHVTPALLANLGYSEWSGYGYVGFEGYGNLPIWAYEPPDRHDFALADRFARVQDAVLAQIFQPLVLSRIAEGASETADPHPMRLADLFDWMQASVFRELRTPGTSIEASRRTLQQHYTAVLAKLVNAPEPGTPEDASSLARAELTAIAGSTQHAANAATLDSTTRAHLVALRARALAALHGGGTQ